MTSQPKSAALASAPRTVSEPDKIDLFVGVKIRTRRHALGLSQTDLADRIGVSFQQVQKYERGTNRVSASMLVHIAKALDMAPSWFFHELPDALSDELVPSTLQAFLASPDGQDWSRLGALLMPHVRRGFMNAIVALIDGEGAL